MESRKRKSTNGVKLFCGSTAILFGAVFLLSRLPGVSSEPDSVGTDESGASISETGTADDTSFDSFFTGGDDIPEAETLPNDDYVEEDEDSEGENDPENTETENKEPKPDPADADNTWAMFLVNTKNQVPREYCDGIETAWVYESYKPFYMDSRMSEYLKQMVAAADDDGIQLIVASAYRTFGYQEDNFNNSVQDRIDNRGMTAEEAEADTLREVQRPGCSEHNAGVAADILSVEEISMDDDRFKNTEAYAWLQENAADYGFILRYPEGKEDITGIVFEPWHYRFVGVYYAKLITDKGITLEEFFEEMNWVDENGVAIDHLPSLY